MSKPCKHTARATSRPTRRRQYDAHLRRHWVDLLKRFLSDDPSVGTCDVVGDGFCIRFRRGHNGALLITLVED